MESDAEDTRRIKQSFSFVRTELIRETPLTECPVLPTSRDAFQYAVDNLFDENPDKEAFWAIHLDGKHRIMGCNLVSLGTATASLVHPREVFRPAIAACVVAIILVHNHPSGDPSPSAEDIEITQRLIEVGRLVGIRILDHVIVGDGCFSSCSERGIL